MKNIKNTLLATSAALAAGLLAALCSGCDGSGGEVDEGGDAGRVDAGAGRADVVRRDAVAATDVKPGTCSIPTPKFSLNGRVSTTPRVGYRFVNAEDVQCIVAIAGAAQPTNCSDPVDGFAISADQPWYCMVTQQVAGGKYEVVSPILREMGKNTMAGVPGPGDIALCSQSGDKFLGWGCS